MTFKAAIFDFNGTLFWDTKFHDSAFDIMLLQHGVKLSDVEKRTKIHGKTNPIIMRGIFGEAITDTEVEKMSNEKELIYRQLCVNDLQLAPGAEDLFNYLVKKEIPINIATSADIENLNFYFQNMHLKKWFSIENVAYDNGSFRGKPFPDVFITAAAKMGLTPHETVIFEDSFAGIQAAEQAGAGKIYIVNSNNNCFNQFSHQIISHFDEVDRGVFTI